MDENFIEWKDFELSVELHKSYLDFAVKINLFHYAITGAILSFHFTNKIQDISIIALLLPITLSIFLGGFFLYGAILALNLRSNIKNRAEKLNLHVYPEGIVLVILCIIFGTAMLLTGFSLLYYVLT